MPSKKNVFDRLGDSVNTAGNAANDLVQGNDTNLNDLFSLSQAAGKSGSSGNVPYVSGIGPYEMPGVPELQPYTGVTWVPIPKGYRSIEDSILGLTQDPNSKYNTVMSGDPNMELFNKYIDAPMQQQLTTQTLPQIASQYGSTPYGGSIYSGAAADAKGKAIQDSFNKEGELRMQYDQNATSNMLNAAGQLPGFANVFGNEQQMTANNLNRKIDVYYKNEQLKQMMFEDSMQQLGVQIGVDQFNTGVDQFNQTAAYQQSQIEAAQNAAMWSSLGTIGGAGLGALFGGPTGALIGSQVGGQAGNFFGGGTANPGATQSTVNSMALLSALDNVGKPSTTVAAQPTTSIYQDPLRLNQDTSSFFNSPTTNYYDPNFTPTLSLQPTEQHF